LLVAEILVWLYSDIFIDFIWSFIVGSSR